MIQREQGKFCCHRSILTEHSVGHDVCGSNVYSASVLLLWTNSIGFLFCHTSQIAAYVK